MTPRFPAGVAGHVMMSVIRTWYTKKDTNLRNKEGDMNKQRINSLLKFLSATFIYRSPYPKISECGLIWQ